MKWCKRFFSRLFNWLSQILDKHPIITIFLVFLFTYVVIKENRYLESILYIALAISIVLIYGLSKVRTDKNTRVFKVIGVIIIAFIGLAYILSGILTFVPAKYRILEISEWIGVLSTIFGGFLTMFGVWFSIEETKKLNNKTLIVQSIPLLSTSIENQLYATSSYTDDVDEKVNKSKDVGIFLKMNIENTTNFGAKDFNFEEFNIQIFDVFEYELFRRNGSENIKSIFRHDFAQNLNEKIREDIVLFQNNSFTLDIFFTYPITEKITYIVVINAILDYKYFAHNEYYKTKIGVEFIPEIELREIRKSKHNTYKVKINPTINQYFIKNDKLFSTDQNQFK